MGARVIDLLTPTDHQGAYEWAAVLFAHSFIGLLLVAAVAAVLEVWAGEWIDDLGGLSFGIVVMAYLIAWEGAIQGFGAGWQDALADTFAVACGGALGLLAWQRKPARMALVAMGFAVVAWLGVRARK